MLRTPIPRLASTGDLEAAVLYAGESCSLIGDIKPAAQIVRDFENEAEAIVRRLTRA